MKSATQDTPATDVSFDPAVLAAQFEVIERPCTEEQKQAIPDQKRRHAEAVIGRPIEDDEIPYLAIDSRSGGVRVYDRPTDDPTRCLIATYAVPKRPPRLTHNAVLPTRVAANGNGTVVRRAQSSGKPRASGAKRTRTTSSSSSDDPGDPEPAERRSCENPGAVPRSRTATRWRRIATTPDSRPRIATA